VGTAITAIMIIALNSRKYPGWFFICIVKPLRYFPSVSSGDAC
jgi:hypothetical protein